MVVMAFSVFLLLLLLSVCLPVCKYVCYLYTNGNARPASSLYLPQLDRQIFHDGATYSHYYQLFRPVDVSSFEGIFQPTTADDMMVASLLYALRLNPTAKAVIEEVLEDSLPCDFDPHRTISMPIRGSDKCIGAMHVGETPGESDCHDLATYMEAAELIREQDPRVSSYLLLLPLLPVVMESPISRSLPPSSPSSRWIPSSSPQKTTVISCMTGPLTPTDGASSLISVTTCPPAKGSLI